MEMNEMIDKIGSAWASLFSGMSSGDKAFFCFSATMVVAYLGKLWFDNASKAMEYGYDASFSSSKFGNMNFTKGKGDEDAPPPSEPFSSEDSASGVDEG